MQKITFKNGQAPYVNDTNLNQLQANIEEEINGKATQIQTNIENLQNAKQDKITNTSAQLTVGTYLGQVDINNVARFGNVCRVDFRAKILSDIGNNVSFLKLPFVPAHSTAILFGIGERYSVSEMKWAYATTTENGYIKGNDLTAGKYIHMSFTYICQG